MGIFSGIGKAISGAIGLSGNAALGPLGLFIAPIFSTLDGLIPGGSGGGGSSAQGGFASVPQNTSAGSTINALRKFEQIPAVIGTMRVSPVAATPAWTEPDQREDLIVKQIFTLQGEHDSSDIEINGASIDSYDTADVNYEIRSGADSDTPLTLITESVFEEILNTPLPGYKFEANSLTNLADQATPANSRPKWIFVKSKDNPDEIWVDLVMPRGLTQVNQNNYNSMAFRMTVGGRKLPEFRFRERVATQMRLRVRLVFGPDPGGGTPANWGQLRFPGVIFNHVPSWGSDPDPVNWTADPYFGTAEAASSFTSNTLHYDAGYDTLTFYLDPNDATNPWPKQKYEIGVQRAYGGIDVYTQNDDNYFGVAFNSGVYFINGFYTRDPAERSEVTLRSVSTYRNEHPIATTGLWLLAITARNLTISNVSVLASGKTPDFVGGNWNTTQATSNPASWLRRLRTDPFLAEPLPDAIRDDDDFEALHAHCVSEGLEVNMVVEGNRTIDGDLFEQICSAAYAKKRNGATWGVWIDKDRSADVPVGVLTPVNAGELTISKAFDNTRLPEAIRVRWRDSTNDYATAIERIHYRNGFSSTTPNLKIVTVDAPGKVTEAEVDEWAIRFLKEVEARDSAYQCEVDWEALQYEAGDLIALSYDTINRKHGYAIVKSVQTSGANVTGLTFQSDLQIGSIAGLDLWSEPDAWALDDAWGNVAIGVGLRYLDGTIVYKAINEFEDTSIITFATPFTIPTHLVAGCVVWSGELNSEDRRVYIDSIDGMPDIGARLICVDEAPNIHP